MAGTPLPEPQYTLDMSQVASQYMPGAQLDTVDADGTARFRVPQADGTTKPASLNPAEYLKGQGMDPSKVKVQYNNPATALPENPIGFADGTALALHSPKGQLKWLQQKYGNDNVTYNAEGDGLVVKDQGVWKQANPGFLSNLAASAPEVGGAVAGGGLGLGLGAAAGGLIGTLVAPGPGTVAGMAIGGWMGELIGASGGAALATVVKQQGSDVLGLHTQLDTKAAMETFGRETVNNLLWGSMFKAGGAAVKGSIGIAEDFFKPRVDKVALAEFAEKQMPGTSRADWGTLVRSGDDAQAVMKNMKMEQAWKQSEATGQTIGAVSPLMKRTEQVVTDFMESAESKAQAKMGEGLKAIDEAGHMNAQTNLTDPINQLKTKLGNLGILGKNKDTGEAFVSALPHEASAEHLPQIWGKNNINSLNEILQLVQNPKVISETNELSFGTARKLQRSLSNIMDNTGVFDGTGSLSRETRAALQEFRAGIGQKMGAALEGKTVSIKGEAQDAATFWNKMNRDYSTYRQYADQFGKVSTFGGDTQQISNAVGRMLGPKGAGLEQAFSGMADAVGADAKTALKELQQLRAGQNLTEAYSNQAPQGLIASVKNRVVDTVKGGVRRDLGPAANAERLGNKTVSSAEWSKAWENGILSKMPSNGASKTAVEAQAHLSDFLNSMPLNARSALLSNGLALRQLSNAVTAAPQMQQNTYKNLMNLVGNVAGSPNGSRGPLGAPGGQ